MTIDVPTSSSMLEHLGKNANLSPVFILSQVWVIAGCFHLFYLLGLWGRQNYKQCNIKSCVRAEDSSTMLSGKCR